MLMTTNYSAEQFSVEDIVTVRLLQLYTYAADLKATTAKDVETLREAQELGNPDLWSAKAPAKRDALAALATATIEVSHHLAGRDRDSWAELEDTDQLAQTTATLLSERGESLTASLLQLVMLEAATSTDWPKGINWVVDRFDTLSRGARHLDASVTAESVRRLHDEHRRASKRIRKDAIAPGAQVGMGVFVASAWMLTGGAAHAVGASIGTHLLGLHGAAATSAGLAFLGGGSLAHGGLGMAGGALLVGTATHVASATGRHTLGSMLAKQSSATFINELAKLDVRAQNDPEFRPFMLPALQALEKSLSDDWNACRPQPAARRSRLMGHLRAAIDNPTGIMDHARSAIAELPPQEERNLASSVRAVQYEIRYLEAPEWRRTASRLPRALGMPALSRALDSLDETVASASASASTLASNLDTGTSPRDNDGSENRDGAA